MFVHNTLVGAALRQKIKIGAAGKIVSAFDIATVMALGADWTNAGRGFMFAIGCIQSLSCHTNQCPTGVATQYPMYRNTLLALSEMIAAAGLDHPSRLGPHHLVRRVSLTEIRLFSQPHIFLEDGELLNGCLGPRLLRRRVAARSARKLRDESIAAKVLALVILYRPRVAR